VHQSARQNDHSYRKNVSWRKTLRQSVADYVADFLIEHGIDNLFEVVGGGAMYLNDAFGHKKGMNVIYHHHEQAAAIAAEAYARLNNNIAAVCVTSGPGATNAITGCLCAYVGSIPMIIFSGQVRYTCTVKAQGLALRTNGEQEYDICKSVEAMTKYCEMVIDPYRIQYSLEKALYLAKSGRPGPVWLDLPLDVQSAVIDTDNLRNFDPEMEGYQCTPSWDRAIVKEILLRVHEARRPILFCGMGIRLAGAYGDFLRLVDLLNIPVTTGMTTVDYIPNDHPLYAGRTGITGDRAGNFAVQNSDLFLSIGSRLSYKQTGYDTRTWARSAYKIMVDIDPEELKRTYLGIDLAVNADAGDFIISMIEEIKSSGTKTVSNRPEWITQCKEWVRRYPVVTPDRYDIPDGKGSTYVFYSTLSKLMPEGAIYVTSAGTSRVICNQAVTVKSDQRIISNTALAPMGYDLPAAIGVCIANYRKPIVLITGEGGFQMNIQELQTIEQNNLPIKIIVINNEGYHSIRITQDSFFKKHTHVGIGEESGDLSFPDLSKIAYAYGFKYFESRNLDDLERVLTNLLDYGSYAICQVFVTKTQSVLPKVTGKQLEDGSMVSMPLENMAPFLSREELRKNMLIDLVEGTEEIS